MPYLRRALAAPPRQPGAAILRPARAHNRPASHRIPEPLEADGAGRGAFAATAGGADAPRLKYAFNIGSLDSF